MIYFIGAGPGDPELITVKGKRILANCQVVIYAGSLINPALLHYTEEKAEKYDSSYLSLEEIIKIMEKAHGKGYNVARLHSGDPSLYGAIREQIEELKKRQISFEIVPGVSSFTGASAVLQKELTVPGISQTVILTRLSGRTPVPENESLEKLALHGSTMVVFLSTERIKEVVEKLREGYHPRTPAAVVYHATWEDQVAVRGNLSDIAKKVQEAEIRRSALLIVGNVLGEEWYRSFLYNPLFKTQGGKK
ncbi:MAG: precorrin-4 C(11)-methyltransferase [Candidatus Caldatribacteriaceae bacterium]